MEKSVAIVQEEGRGRTDRKIRKSKQQQNKRQQQNESTGQQQVSTQQGSVNEDDKRSRLNRIINSL